MATRKDTRCAPDGRASDAGEGHPAPSRLSVVGFALIVYVVIDGFSHGMFDLQIMPAVSLTALATFAALTLAMIDGRANRSLRAPWMYGTGAALTLFVGCLALAAALGHGGFDLGFVKNLALFTAIVALVRSPRRLSWLLAVAGAAGVLQATLGIRQVVLAHGIPAGGVTGLLPNHVQYAMYMTLSVIALAPFVLRTYGLRRVAIVAAEALMLGVIVASLARGVLVVAVVCALVFVLITLRSVAARVLASAGTLALAAGALVASDRLGTLIKIPAALGDPVRLDALLSGRLPMLLAAWNMWAAQPVVGVGYGRFPELWSHYVPPGIGIPGVLRLELAAHSTYLQIAAELGVVGLGLYIWLLASGLRDAALARRGFKRSAEATGSWMAAAILVGLLAVTLHGVLDNTGWHDRVLYILLALSVAARGLAPEGMPRLTGEAT